MNSHPLSGVRANRLAITIVIPRVYYTIHKQNLASIFGKKILVLTEDGYNACGENDLRLHRMRRADREMVRAVPGVRRVEHHEGGGLHAARRSGG